eukprot:1686748-Rhodomonas_salina.2
MPSQTYPPQNCEYTPPRIAKPCNVGVLKRNSTVPGYSGTRVPGNIRPGTRVPGVPGTSLMSLHAQRRLQAVLEFLPYPVLTP